MSDDTRGDAAHEYPRWSRVYQNHHLDGPRWDRFETRTDDIVVTTAYKSGTTWMQTIIAHLIFEDGEFPGPVMQMFPWVDMRVIPFDVITEGAAAQTHRRCFKTHLARDGMTLREDVKYIYVGRDLRDVFMSLWNHYGGYTEAAYANFNNPDGLVGDPIPQCPSDIHEVWRGWVSRGWFEWEEEGYPFWSSSHHAQTWWDYRHLPNILFVHFADLLEAPRDEIARVANFLEIDVSDERLDRVVDAVEFKNMKRESEKVMGMAEDFFDGGINKFMNKGTNGRWREVLGEKELAQYRDMLRRALSPECARWLEEGRSALKGAAIS